ncbi:MAG: TIGR03560 family F420-dependent LLM class oxidoreductase [Nitrososphaerales archaeon]
MVIFGVLLPQDGKTYVEIAETAKVAETLGFNSFWLFDHFMPFTFGKKKDYLESWTTLSALASETSSIRLGILVSCSSYRNPALLTKMASTLDVLSKGRLEFGIGAGWYREEYEAYGYPFPKAGVRITQLREAISIIKGLWTTTSFTFEGQYYKVKDAICEPKPVQQPHPPILIGGNKRKMLKLMAEKADIANFGFKIAGLNKTLKTLDDFCRVAGRAPSTLVKSYTGVCLIDKGLLKMFLGTPHLDVVVAGSPKHCADKIDKLVMRGFTYIILYFVGKDRLKAMEVFAKEVMSVF